MHPSHPLHPEANSIVENFNRSLKKLIRTAKFENKEWRSELLKFLHNYRNSPHSTTGKPPSSLLFNRPVKSYLPSSEKYKPKEDSEIRKLQNEKYEKVKTYTDNKRKAKRREINIGDRVLIEKRNTWKKE